VFVGTDSVGEWAQTLSEFDEGRFEPAEIRSWAERFAAEEFDRKVHDSLDERRRR
jgi:hypothetical protein